MIINFKDIHPKNFLASDFWFSVDRVSLHLIDRALFGFALVLIAFAIVLKLVAIYRRHPVTKKLLNRFVNVFLWTGLVEALWFALRYENARVIGTHLVAVIILLIGLACAIAAIKYWITRYRPERDAWDKEQLKQKYLQK